MISKQDRQQSQDECKLPLAEKLLYVLSHVDGGNSLQFFATPTLSTLARTSTAMWEIFIDELSTREKLLTFVILGKQSEAEALIKKKPNLLLSEAKATDYSGTTFITTPFRAALSCGDKLMWEMMLPYLGQKEASKQFHEQFPSGVEDNISTEDLKQTYDTLAKKIINNQAQHLSIIETFRNELSSNRVITQGETFNLQHLIAAYQAYIDNYDALTDKNVKKIFWRNIIGYLQRNMSSYDIQVLNSGIEEVLKNNSIDRLLFDYSDIYPLSPNSGLGFEFAYAFLKWDAPIWHAAQSVATVEMSITCLKKYVEKKQLDLLNLESTLLPRKQESIDHQDIVDDQIDALDNFNNPCILL